MTESSFTEEDRERLRDLARAIRRNNDGSLQALRIEVALAYIEELETTVKLLTTEAHDE